MFPKLFPALLLASLTVFHPPVTSAAPPSIELVVPGYSYPRPVVGDTFAIGIAEDGKVVGFFFVNGVANASYRRTAGGRFSPPLLFPGSNDTLALGTNNHGLICGTYSIDSPHGFFYDGQTYTQYDYPGAAQTAVAGVNDAGDFCGYYDPGSTATATPFVNFGGVATSFTLEGVESVYPTAIDNLGQVAGWYQDPVDNLVTHGFVRAADGTLTYPIDYPGARATFFLGMNDQGLMVGNWIDSSFKSHGFLLDQANHFLSYDYPGGLSTSLSDINGSGLIAGFYFDVTDGVRHAFIAQVVR